MYELKLGLGGNGLQPFNTETGQYENMDVTLPDGSVVSNYDKFLEKKLPREYMIAYQSNPSVKESIDNAFQPIYQKLLQRAIDSRNRETKKSNFRFFETVEDAVNGAPETITKEFVDFIVENGFPSKMHVRAYGDTALPSMIVGYMRGRYPQTKFNAISEDEFQARMLKCYSSIYDMDWGQINTDMMRKAVASGLDIPIFRGLSGISRDISSRNDTVSSFVSDDYGSITNIGKAQAFGSCIYMSLTKSYSMDEGYYDNQNGILLHGMVRSGALKHVLDYSDFGWTSPDSLQDWARGEGLDIVRGFAKATESPEFEESIKNAFLQHGMNEETSKKAAEMFCEYIRCDIGFCASVLGFDAIYGFNGTLDILDPSVIDLSTSWE